MKAIAYRIAENGKALKELTEKHGVILHDTPKDYFVEYQKATNKVIEKYKAENAFFKKVWDCQKEFADGRPVLGAGAAHQREPGRRVRQDAEEVDAARMSA